MRRATLRDVSRPAACVAKGGPRRGGLARRRALGAIGAERLERRSPDRHDALLPPLAEDAHEARLGVERGPVEARELAHAQARRVQQLDDRAVAQAEHAGGGGGDQQTIDLVEAQVRRQLLPGLRGCDADGRVGSQPLRVDEEAKQPAHRSQLARDRGAIGGAVERAQPAADRFRTYAVGRVRTREREELAEVARVGPDRVRRRMPSAPEVRQVRRDRVLRPCRHAGGDAINQVCLEQVAGAVAV